MKIADKIESVIYGLFVAMLMGFVLFSWIFSRYGNKEKSMVEKTPVFIIANDTFSTSRGWKMDTFISFDRDKRRLDTTYWFKK